MERTRAGDERPTVLVVDDEPEAADLHADYLGDDHTVLTAYSGEEALELLSGAVDVVLLDRLMPSPSGDDVLEEIRASGVDCRVVFVTAVDPDLDVLDLPFDDYLVKPVSREAVRDVVARMRRRDTYDERIGELVTLASRMATLESKMDLSELQDSEQYDALQKRLTELRGRTRLDDPDDDLYGELTAQKVRILLG